MNSRNTCIVLWAGAACVTAGSLISAGMLPAHAAVATMLAAVASGTGCALAFDLTGRGLFPATLPALAVATQGAGAALVVWSAGALVLLARIKGHAARPAPGFVTRARYVRRVLIAPFPGAEGYRALLEGFAGPEEELRASVAPLASLPPSIAIPVLARLSLHPDSATRLTARKRLELVFALLREDDGTPPPRREKRNAALRIRKVERHLVLADFSASDDERRRLLANASELATEASDDLPGNHHYAAFASVASARAGRPAEARRLLLRVNDPRRAKEAARVLMLCRRMLPSGKDSA